VQFRLLVNAWTRPLCLLVLLLGACASEGSYENPEREQSADEAACTDIAPGNQFTCGEQVGWDKCDEPFMAGFCNRSCGRCAGIGNGETCVDVAPGDAFSCEEQASWGKCDEPWMEGFCQVSCGTCSISTQLIDPQASANARELMSYLVSVHGDAIVSGQQKRADADHMAALTGRFPAIVGFDFMDYSPSRVAHGSSSDETDKAIDWWLVKGGIVTISWHWNAPANLVDSEEIPWWKGFYTKGTSFDFAKAMNDRQSTERELIIRDIDAIAAQLQRLEDAGVPILWRPIHEASGKWFWWGAHGAEAHMALWRLLYDRLVNHHQLHNLIWVWNGQDGGWYPGDQYVDIVAEDIYEDERDHSPQASTYRKAKGYASTSKLVALSETGALLDPQELQESAARWSWFMLWSGDFATAQAWNEDSMKKKVYSSDFVITLDELPVLGTSP
jgi:mannan endo-1,4-beta-mannosidase